MLTKEEADDLLQIIVTGEGYKSTHGLLIDFDKIESCINDFTEKPKRRIQVGDIYRDKEGFIREIEEHHHLLSMPPKNHFMSKCGYEYDERGKYVGQMERADLDLSKRYKLVEIENE